MKFRYLPKKNPGHVQMCRYTFWLFPEPNFVRNYRQEFLTSIASYSIVRFSRFHMGRENLGTLKIWSILLRFVNKKVQLLSKRHDNDITLKAQTIKNDEQRENNKAKLILFFFNDWLLNMIFRYLTNKYFLGSFESNLFVIFSKTLLLFVYEIIW